MTARQLHARAKEIFAAACARPESERPAFLSAACGGDDELRREVESLLDFHHDTTEAPRSRTPVPESARETTRFTGRFNPGEVFAGRYRIVSLLGVGGMGEVYRAHDQVLDVEVALKFISRADSERRQRLLNEVRLARRVTHPSVCRVYDVGQVGHEYFLSMEYVEGEDLSSLLRRVKRFPGDRLLDVAHQLCAGLAAAHAKGVLHQDLKPANVLIDDEGKVRITDFGIATTLDAAEREVLGTPAYMAPERLAGQAATVASDLYALGLVLYEMASGRPVFRASTPVEYAVLHRSVVPEAPSSHISDLDPRLEAVILACLEKDPRSRPASALEVAAALPGGDPLKLAVEAGETPSPELVARVRSGDEGLRPGVVAALLALLAAALAGVFLVAARAYRLPPAGELKPPRVLAERAQQILRDLGHGEIGFDDFGLDDDDLGAAPRGRAWGFQPDNDSAGEPAVRFWYRQSPFPLIPGDAWRLVFDEPRVAPEDPPPTPTEEGMAQMVLDAQGRLMMMYLLPAILEEDVPPAVEDGPDWSAALAAGGFDPREVRPAEGPRRVPPVYADERRAWTGADPRAASADAPRIHIDAAAYRGRVVYFSAWPEPGDEQAYERSFLAGVTGLRIFSGGLILLALAAVVVASVNVRRGRGDLRGARRLVLFVVAAKLAYWLLAAYHVTDLEDEIVNLHLVLGVALVEALLVWVAYIALEPTVRRFWPRTLISWSRVLRGRLRDPLVGRSLLVGAAVGTVWGLARAADLLAAGWLGLAPGQESDAAYYQLEVALNGRLPLANLLTGGLYAIYSGVVGLFLLVLLRVIGRRAWVAIAAFVVVQGGLEMLSSGHPEVAWLTLGVVIVGSAAWILVRFGLLTYIAALFVENVLTGFPITADLSAWYAGAGLLALALPVAVAGFGAWQALAGQTLLEGWLGAEQVGPSSRPVNAAPRRPAFRPPSRPWRSTSGRWRK